MRNLEDRKRIREKEKEEERRRMGKEMLHEAAMANAEQIKRKEEQTQNINATNQRRQSLLLKTKLTIVNYQNC